MRAQILTSGMRGLRAGVKMEGLTVVQGYGGWIPFSMFRYELDAVSRKLDLGHSAVMFTMHLARGICEWGDLSCYGTHEHFRESDPTAAVFGLLVECV